MSVGVPSRSRPYSTSTLFGRSAPLRNWRSLPSSPKTARPPSGAATFIVPRIEALRRVGSVDPDRRIVGIVRQRRRWRAQRLDGAAASGAGAVVADAPRHAASGQPTPGAPDDSRAHQKSNFTPKSIHQR